MGWFDYVEYILGTLLYRRRGYDHDLFFKSPAFKNFPEPNIKVEAPEIGPSYSRLSKTYSAYGSGRIPDLRWSLAQMPNSDKVKEYLLVFEDPDAPMGHSNVHGIYAGIPASRFAVGPSDFEPTNEEGALPTIKAGFTVGANRKKTVYIPARPPLGHGPHRYFFNVVALTQALEPAKVGELPTAQHLKALVEGKVAGWGCWVGTYESKWDRYKPTLD